MFHSKHKNKNTSIAFAFLLQTLILGVSCNSNDIIKSSCSSTLYPDICYSTLSTLPPGFVVTKKDVIEMAVNKTKETIHGYLTTIKKLTNNHTKRGRFVVDDCLEMVAETLQDLDTVIQDLKAYPRNKSLEQDADNLKTLMSTTITNMETCLDGLEDKELSKSIVQGKRLCSNVLAMIKNMTDSDIAKKQAGLKAKARNKWPQWLPARDRKLFLWFNEVKPNVTVSKDGKGNYTTVAAAVAAAPIKSKIRYVIKIAPGTYKEYVEIPKNKTNIMFLGDKRDNTIITGSRSVVGGSTTFNSATVAAMGKGFLARDITFENTAGAKMHQAVALRVQSDMSAFYRCAILGYQDTLYALSNRQFYVGCLITGTVDFIFGNAAAVFQFCDILARRPDPHQGNMVTAQGRMDPNQNTGIVIQRCKIGGTADLRAVYKNFSTYLGRPWKKYSRTVIMRSMISEVIDPAGWAPWDKEFALDTLYYREFRNSGPGAETSKRVKWKGWGIMLTFFEAIPFSVGSFINGWSWLLSTGFPFWPFW